MSSLFSGLISGFIISLCFAIIYNVATRHMLAAALNGAWGVLLLRVCQPHVGVLIANLIASIGISLLAELLARLYRSPATSFSVAALIPLVPGGAMYQSLLALLQNENAEASTYAMQTLQIACCIVIGMLLATGLRVLWHRRTPVTLDDS